MVDISNWLTLLWLSQNVDILAKVSALKKFEHCQTLRVVSTFTAQNELTVFDW